MNKTVLVYLGFALLFLVVTYLVTPSMDLDDAEQQHALPWLVTQHADGSIESLGIRLGQTTVAELGERFHHVPDVGVFLMADGSRSLEAYYGTQTVGFLDAKLLAVLQVDDAQLDEWLSHPGERHAQPSGAYKVELAEADLNAAFQLRINEFTYSPVATFDEPFVLKRFGEPQHIVDVGEQGIYWMYPDKGVMAVFAEGRALFHYLLPRAMPDRLLKLQALSQSSS